MLDAFQPVVQLADLFVMLSEVVVILVQPGINIGELRFVSGLAAEDSGKLLVVFGQGERGSIQRWPGNLRRFGAGLVRVERAGSLFEALGADAGEPLFDRLGFGRRDGLDDAQQGLGIRCVRTVILSVGRPHFQLLAKCQQLTEPFVLYAAFHVSPIHTGSWRICQQADHVNDAEEPAVVVPEAADGAVGLFFDEREAGVV